jgi:hypothetical protein
MDITSRGGWAMLTMGCLALGCASAGKSSAVGGDASVHPDASMDDGAVGSPDSGGTGATGDDGGPGFEVGGGDGAGETGGCVPPSCASLGVNCGAVTDTKCGGVIDCGSCPSGQSCGVGGHANVCGASGDGGACVPSTCATAGVGCGVAGDGCGGVLSCGGCSSPKTCGGDPAKPAQCGCTGSCAGVPSCPGAGTTTLTGVVKDPAGLTVLPNVLVYVPNDPSDPALTTTPSGLTCDECGAVAAGNPLVSTHTATDGSFSLTGVPVGTSVPLVIQVGRWRRIFSASIPNACATNVVAGTGTGGGAIAGGVLTMPKNHREGDIPKTAIVTGLGDQIECIFRKMGIDDAEFENPGGAARIDFYQSAANTAAILAGAYIDLSTPDSTALPPKLGQYDMVIMGCPGDEAKSTGDDPLLGNIGDLAKYVNGGGRLFASHYAYTYLTFGASNPFAGVATWSSAHTKFLSATATVDTNPSDNPKGAAFADWLGKVSALTSTSPPAFTVAEARNDVTSVTAPTQQWLFNGATSPASPLYFTFNTPIGAAPTATCGRVLFSDFHPSTGASGDVAFPSECDGKPMSAQEKVFEYMLFDLSSCVAPYSPICTPKTCSELGADCGPAGDGCGGALDCGTCGAGMVCGGGGPSKCGAPVAETGAPCTPASCATQGIQCGPAGDGCGNAIDCGNCPTGQICGFSGPGKCGSVH